MRVHGPGVFAAFVTAIHECRYQLKTLPAGGQFPDKSGDDMSFTGGTEFSHKTRSARVEVEAGGDIFVGAMVFDRDGLWAGVNRG